MAIKKLLMQIYAVIKNKPQTVNDVTTARL
jgi:hypothetical protein